MARVLFATFGSLGDLHPYIAVGRALQARGHIARIATSVDYREAVQSEGLEFAPMAPSLADFGAPEELARRVFDPLRGTQHLVRDLLMPHLRESHRDLHAAALDADLLVSHPLTFMLQVVAGQLGKPWLSTVLAPASFLSRQDPPVMAPINSFKIAQALGPWAYVALMRIVRSAVRRWERPLHDYRRELGLTPNRTVYLFEGQFSPSGTLALFDPVLMAPQPDWPAHTRVCGAAVYDGAVSDPTVLGELAEFLAAGASPIVFALGSSAVYLGARFWEAAIEASVRLGRRAILITGPGTLPPTPPTVRAFHYLPYSAVFPRACALVHQAGIGTLSQALRAGRPQLLTPVAFDQPDNAARTVRLGTARVLPFAKVNAERLARELQALLAVPDYADAAMTVAAGLGGVEGAAAAADLLIAQCSERPAPRS